LKELAGDAGLAVRLKIQQEAKAARDIELVGGMDIFIEKLEIETDDP
jgi:hypothetical protein